MEKLPILFILTLACECFCVLSTPPDKLSPDPTGETIEYHVLPLLLAILSAFVLLHVIMSTTLAIIFYKRYRKIVNPSWQLREARWFDYEKPWFKDTYQMPLMPINCKRQTVSSRAESYLLNLDSDYDSKLMKLTETFKKNTSDIISGKASLGGGSAAEENFGRITLWAIFFNDSFCWLSFCHNMGK